MGYTIVNGELYHFGVKGMKWGVRKKTYDNVLEKRKAYRQAYGEYNKSFNKAYNRAIGAYSPIKKHRVNAQKRWEDVYDKGLASDKARAEYKEAKKAMKAERKENKARIRSTYKKMQDRASIGDRLLYSDGTRKKAAKYVVNNNMTYAEAEKRAKSDANRNTAVFVAAYGAITLASLYASSRK